MPSFDFSKLGYYQNLFLFTFVTSRLALILPPSEITADNSGSWSDSNPIVIQCLKKTGSANWTRSRSEWDYNPIRLTRQKRAYGRPAFCFCLHQCSCVFPLIRWGWEILLHFSVVITQYLDLFFDRLLIEVLLIDHRHWSVWIDVCFRL